MGKSSSGAGGGIFGKLGDKVTNIASGGRKKSPTSGIGKAFSSIMEKTIGAKPAAALTPPTPAAPLPGPTAGPTAAPMNFAAPDQAMEKLKKQGTLLSGGNSPSLYSR